MKMAIFSIKVLLISSVAITTGLLLKLREPETREFFTSVVPQIWASLLSWLTPPYLYLIVNGIIISIAASSRFHRKIEEGSDLIVPFKGQDPTEVQPEFNAAVYRRGEKEEEEEEAPERRDSTENSIVREKPRVSVSFWSRKRAKGTHSHQGNKGLSLARPERHETMESIWKMIMEGRPVAHMKKSDTWERNRHPRSNILNKSDTMRERSSTPLSPPLLIPERRAPVRREPSLSQEELNQRVEEFIKKFNQEIRLQRRDSLE